MEMNIRGRPANRSMEGPPLGPISATRAVRDLREIAVTAGKPSAETSKRISIVLP